MAVIGQAELMAVRDGARGQLGRGLIRNQYRVITNDAHDDAGVVLLAPNLPLPYQPHPLLPKLLCRSIIPRQADKSRTIWYVTAEYDTEYDRFENPLTEPPELIVGSETYEMPLPGRARTNYDASQNQPISEDPAVAGNDPAKGWGEGIITSAGEPYDPPPTITQSRPVITFIKNYGASFTIAYKVKFENTVNSEPWSGLQARQAWIRAINATTHVRKSASTTINDIYYVRVEHVFVLKAETHDLQLLDIGSYYLDYATGTAVRKTFEVEGSGEPRMGLLDNANAAQPGKKLAAGAAAKFNRYRVFREENYSQLGIDLNLAMETRRANPG